jgi:hypothetical protein
MAVTQVPKVAARNKQQDKADARVVTGEAAAAFIAGGIGCFVIGLMVTLTEMPALVGLKNALVWSPGVGPLSGKTGVGVIAFFLSWIVAHATLKNRDINLQRAVIIAAILTALGFLMTFPPFFDLFAGG